MQRQANRDPDLTRAKRGARTLFGMILAGGLLVAVWRLSVGSVHAADWHSEKGFRWAELTVQSGGRTGFTSMAPGRTGVQFTNRLDERASAGNRVLENGAGVAIGDYDGDGWPDLFLASVQSGGVLYRNRGDWHFEEMTEPAGLSGLPRALRGAVFADLDGDGGLDLLLTTVSEGVRYLRNRGDGTFDDRTEASGLGGRCGATTLALADVDGDGRLDLYVTTYRPEDVRDDSLVEIRYEGGKPILHPRYAGRLFIANDGLQEFGEPDALYLNEGGGRLRRVEASAGWFRDEVGNPLHEMPKDWGLSAVLRDFDGDGRPDLYVCNDYWTPDRIYLQDPAGRFRAAGTGTFAHSCENSMGIEVADFDRDGFPDLFVVDMLNRDPQRRRRQSTAQTRVPPVSGLVRPQYMRNALWHNRGDGTFEDLADFAGLEASDWAWQALALDVDLDGYEDLLVSAGHRRDLQDLDATARIRALQHPWPKELTREQRQTRFRQELMEHARLYPGMESPVIAFRNRGGMRFEEVTDSWGTDAVGIHQGIAMADLDGDGDLDFVVNNLDSVCSVFRNDSAAPRVMVRLRGAGANSQAIGARVTLVGGAVSRQSQEVMAGGRYLSGSDPALVFAAGSVEGPMSIEIGWRNGRRSIMAGVRGNRIYEVDELAASGGSATGPEPMKGGGSPRFETFRFPMIGAPREAPFDDFERQALLPRQMSRLGPAVAWADLDGDGWEEFVVGAGRGGSLLVFSNERGTNLVAKGSKVTSMTLPRDSGGMVTVGTRLHVAMSAYEDGQAARGSLRTLDLGRDVATEGVAGNDFSVGPLAMADPEGKGEPLLFMGGRVASERYPEPASSLVVRRGEGGWEEFHRFEKLGLASAAIFSDLDGDGRVELIVATEWGALRVFEARADGFSERRVRLEWPQVAAGAPATLDELTGLWNSVAAGDFDGDGRMDLVAGNWGLNGPWRTSFEHPLELHYGDLQGRGVVDVLEAEYDPGRGGYYPRLRLDQLALAMPGLQEKFEGFAAFSRLKMGDVLKVLGSSSHRLGCRNLASMVLLNRGDRFVPVMLPDEAQWSPVFGIAIGDFDGDGREDAVLGQNFHGLPWEVRRCDAGRGLLLLGKGDGTFRSVRGGDSGVMVEGEHRGVAVCDFDHDGRPDVLFGRNGAAPVLLRNSNGKPGLRVRLVGPAGNPAAIGAWLRLEAGGVRGPARELHAGAGYWSQDAPTQVLAVGAGPARLIVRWPGGRETATPVPAGTSELVIDAEGRPVRR